VARWPHDATPPPGSYEPKFSLLGARTYATAQAQWQESPAKLPVAARAAGGAKDAAARVGRGDGECAGVPLATARTTRARAARQAPAVSRPDAAAQAPSPSVLSMRRLETALLQEMMLQPPVTTHRLDPLSPLPKEFIANVHRQRSARRREVEAAGWALFGQRSALASGSHWVGSQRGRS